MGLMIVVPLGFVVERRPDPWRPPRGSLPLAVAQAVEALGLDNNTLFRAVRNAADLADDAEL